MATGYQSGATAFVNILPSFTDFGKELAKKLASFNANVTVGGTFDRASLIAQVDQALGRLNPTVDVQAHADLTRVRTELANVDAPTVTVPANADVTRLLAQLNGVQPQPVSVPVETEPADPLGNLSVGAAAAGLAAGALFMAALGTALEQQTALAKLSATINSNGPEMARLGRVSGNLFASNYGDSFDQVTEAISLVIRNIDGMRDASEADLGRMTANVLSVSKAFDKDLAGTTRAVGQIMRNGLAPDAETALNVLTRGFQMGDDAADDLLDTFAEYSTVFRTLGLDAQTALGILDQGLKAGARDSDQVADGIKENTLLIQGMGSVADATAAAQASKQAAVASAYKGVGAAVKGVESAQRALASAQERASDAANALAEAQKNAGKSVKAAQDAAKNSIQSAKDAAVTAAAQVSAAVKAQAEAYRGVQAAQEKYSDAVRAEKAAQQAVTAARKEALAQIVALRDAQVSAANRVESARIAQMRAQNAADKLAGKQPTYTEQQVEAASTALDLKEANEGLTQARKDAADATAKLSDAEKKGVNGSDVVKSALAGLTTAQRNTRDAALAVSDAQDKYTQSTKNVGAAQAAAAKAERNVAVVRRAAAQSVADAEAAASKSIVAARRAVRDAGTGVGDARAQVADAKAALAEAQKVYQDAVNAPLKLNLDPTQKALQALGLDPDAIKAAYAEGGPKAAAAMDTIFDKLRALPQDQAIKLLPGLFGTMGEDAQKAFLQIDPSTAAQRITDLNNAAQNVNNTLSNTAKGDLATLKRQFEQFGANLASVVVPALTNLFGGLSTVGGYIGSVLGPVFKSFNDLVGGGNNGMTILIGTLGTVVGAVAALKGVMAAYTAVQDAARIAVKLFGAESLIVSAATKIWAGIQVAFNAIMALNPIALVVIAIVALVAIIILAYQHSETFRNIVNAAWTAIKTAISSVWNFLKDYVFAPLMAGFTAIGAAASWLWNTAIVPAWNGIKTAISTVWNFIKTTVIAAFKLEFALIGAVVNVFKTVVSTAWNAIKTAISTAWNFIKTTVIAAFKAEFNLLKTAATVLKDGVVGAWNLIKSGLNAAWNFIKSTIIDPLKTAFTALVTAATTMKDKLVGAWNLVKSGINTVWTFLRDNVFNPVKTFFTDAVTKANDFRDKLVAAFTSVRDKVKPIIDKLIVFFKPLQDFFDKIANGVNSLKDLGEGALGKLAKLIGFKSGGIYPGYTPGRDVGIAAVSGGEAIMRPEWTRAVGPSAVHAMNAAARRGGVGGVRRFMGAYADGGVIPTGLMGIGTNVATLLRDRIRAKVAPIVGVMSSANNATRGAESRLAASASLIRNLQASMTHAIGGFSGAITGITSAINAMNSTQSVMAKALSGVSSILGFKSGGIFPGYTPGRDIGIAAVSGGEAIMRPEWTRAVGPDFVNYMNALAKRGGVSAVRTAFAGHFADGGVVGRLALPSLRVAGNLGTESAPQAGGMTFGDVYGMRPEDVADEVFKQQQRAQALVPVAFGGV